MKLTELAKAIKELGRPKHGFSICIYGLPKVGKTELAITIAKVPQIKRVFLIDTENGHETLLRMYRDGKLTEEEADKINVIAVQDTPERPLGGETVLKLITVQKPQWVCDEHGRVDCQIKTCLDDKGKPKGGTLFDITKLGHDDVVILDSGTSIGNSILNYHMRGKPRDFKPGWDEYGPMGRDLHNLMTIVQACRTNYIVITHQLTIDKEISIKDPNNPNKYITQKVEDVYPLIGTKPFALNCAKYFGHIVYVHMVNNQHRAGSSTNYRFRTLAGSRGGWQIEKLKELSLAGIFDQLYKPEVKSDKDDPTQFIASEQPIGLVDTPSNQSNSSNSEGTGNE